MGNHQKEMQQLNETVAKLQEELSKSKKQNQKKNENAKTPVEKKSSKKAVPVITEDKILKNQLEI